MIKRFGKTMATKKGIYQKRTTTEYERRRRSRSGKKPFFESVRISPVALRLGSEMDPYRRDLRDILHSYLVSNSFGPVLGARA